MNQSNSTMIMRIPGLCSVSRSPSVCGLLKLCGLCLSQPLWKWTTRQQWRKYKVPIIITNIFNELLHYNTESNSCSLLKTDNWTFVFSTLHPKNSKNCNVRKIPFLRLFLCITLWHCLPHLVSLEPSGFSNEHKKICYLSLLNGTYKSSLFIILFN